MCSASSARTVTGQWLAPRAGAFDDVRALDGLWLEDTLQADSTHRVSYQHGVDLVVDAVRPGDAVGGRAHPARERRRDRAHGARRAR